MSSKITDRYCPDCFNRLREGKTGWLWCDAMIAPLVECEFECDVEVNDLTLSYHESLIARLDTLEREREYHLNEYAKKIEAVRAELDALVEAAIHNHKED